ncbi:MAG TPA: gliding motility-associated C-terminal domain-containing protein [Puia sp.]|jgi:gliding motility-associated-like protein|nr:gliding motility-associated C-terminal domain-containing protein [Puia sp.]
MNGLLAQVHPVRIYRSGTIYDTVRIKMEQNRALHKRVMPIPMPYPAFNHAPQSAKHKIVLGGTISLTFDIVDAYCESYNGSVLVHASGGTPPYTYSFDGTAYQSSALYITDGPFNHTVSVKDATGQIATQTVYVGNNGTGPRVYAAAYTQPTGCATHDATITLQGTGGTPPYQYSMDYQNWQTSPTFTGLAYGWYQFWVKDAEGCVSGLPWQWYGCLDVQGDWGYYTCGNSGSMVVTAFDNATYTGPFEYSLDGVNWQSSGSFTGLSPGVVTLQVKDHTGKIGFFEFVISNSCQLSMTATVTDAACGQSNGQIVASATNGTSPYEYSIDGLNFQSSGTFTGLPAGNYTIWVHDLGGTLVWTSAVVMNNCPTVTAQAVAAICGNNNGSITAAGQGGTPPYSFSIDGVNFQSNPVFSPLAPGSYTITIMDADGFMATTTATVVDNCLQVSASATNTTCGQANGAIAAGATGGTPPYTFSIGGAYQASLNFNNLIAGNYMLTVMDQAGNTRSTAVTLTDAAGPAMTVGMHPVDCNGQGGSLTIIASGGTLPLTYSSDGINYGSGNTFTGPAGNYTLYVKDGNGCIATQNSAISVACLHLAVTHRDESCTVNDGEIDITASGGTPAYQYSIDNGTTWQPGAVFSGLTSGNYNVLVQDAGGLSNSISVQLAKVCITGALTAADATCGESNGTITVLASGGATPYTYSIDGTHFQATGVFGALAPGNFTVQIVDANGFSGAASTSIAAIPVPSIAAQTTPASCYNDDGIIDITATGGTPPYQYVIDQGVAAASGHFIGMPSGAHQAVIIDASGCVEKESAVVALNNTVTAGISAPAPVCEGKKVLLAAVSNAETFAWAPAGGLNNSNILAPEAGPSTTTVYTLTASTGICQQTVNTTVTIYPAPLADAGKDDTVCYGASTQLHGSGGNSYSWTPAIYLSDPNALDPGVNDPLTTTTYNLTVTDGNGCTSLQSATVVVTVTPPAAIWIGNDTSILAGQPVAMDVEDINGSGFTSFSWSPATGLSDPSIRDPVASPEESITYTVLATTTAGCQAQGTRSIKVYSVADIFVPNAFTPNGDGHNDVLHARPVGIRDFKFFAVYNRWGQRIFYTTDSSAGWDGRVGGQYVNPSTFVWIAAGIDYRGVLLERTGTVIVAR